MPGRYGCIEISIHASEKEATLVPCVCFVVCKYFNPRLREGGDSEDWNDFVKQMISIHASEKEATATYCDTSTIMYISSLNNFFVHYF